MSTAVANNIKGTQSGTRTMPAAKPTEKPTGEALLDQVVTQTETKWSKATVFRPFGSDDEITLTAGSVQQFLCRPTKNGAKPSFEDCIKFVLLCKSRKLNPWVGDAFMVGYDGKDGPEFNLITSHQAFLKRAEIHKEYDGMESGVIVSNGEEIIDLEGDFFPDGYTLLGAWATVYFKHRSHPMRKRIKLGTFNKGRSVWQSNAAGMIVKCAEADALRSSFPTELGGLYLQGEIPADGETTAPVTPAPAKAATPSLKDRIRGNGSRQTEAPQADGGHDEPPAPPAANEKPQTKPAEQTWEQITNEQMDEIDVAMQQANWSVNDVLKPFRTISGGAVVSLAQLSKSQASQALQNLYAAMKSQGE
jgi:phage recombination protein Bet